MRVRCRRDYALPDFLSFNLFSVRLKMLFFSGLFANARWSLPSLPQYHPRQLMELLNAGRTRRVKAILLHVLRTIRQSRVQTNVTPSMRRMSLIDSTEVGVETSPRRKSIVALEEAPLDYEEIESIPPLPLYALLAADHDEATTTNAAAIGGGEKHKNASGDDYSELFGGPAQIDDDDLGDFDDDDEDTPRRRHPSGASIENEHTATLFTARHNRMLTRHLTHIQLPGLSSVDQMHLLAVADTLSHFSADAIDRLAMANANERKRSTILNAGASTSSAAGGTGMAAQIESVDECGLRFLIAFKQHEYLLCCLPLKQRAQLKARGLSSAHIIWALHSETASELLASLPCMQRNQPTWSELKAVGAGWWLHSIATLRLCAEQLAKAAFQAKQDPLDAAIFYLAMRKKNLLANLYKFGEGRNEKMAQFFANDFDDAFWRKAAQRNAYQLMSKQRPVHAAAFFLLAGSLNDAIQAIVNHVDDLQLAIVVTRLYVATTPPGDTQDNVNALEKLLCTKVLGVEAVDEFGAGAQATDDEQPPLSRGASRDPFIRSMALWLLKEHRKAALTLLHHENDESAVDHTYSSIFYFYSYLRTHPLVIRQKLAAEGIVVTGGTERMLHMARIVQQRVGVSERRLFFKTAQSHLKSGCALLALDVLCRLPRQICFTMPKLPQTASEVISPEAPAPPPAESAASADFDWSAPLTDTDTLLSRAKAKADEELVLEWSDEEGSKHSSEEGDKVPEEIPSVQQKRQPLATQNSLALEEFVDDEAIRNAPIDLLAQQMKFVACLRTMVDELATLVLTTEIESGALRAQLYHWLERQVDMLKRVCDYDAALEERERRERSGSDVDDESEDRYFSRRRLSLSATDEESVLSETARQQLHEALRADHANYTARVNHLRERRKWLQSNQSLLHTLAAYCALHAGSGVGLATARMELLLLLLEMQQNIATVGQGATLTAPLPVQTAFPLLSASLASWRSTVADPLTYLQSQVSDILLTVVEDVGVPVAYAASTVAGERLLSRAYQLYNMCQCLSACLHESLANSRGATRKGGSSHRRRAHSSLCAGDDDENEVRNEISISAF